MTPATRIQSRIDETQIKINTVNGECRSNVRHLQRKLEGIKTPRDVTHELILEVISVGEALRNALSEKHEHVKKIELLVVLRNEELAAKLA
jgi:threonine dehydrogenase-like Zn-dependent dehydrogenase